MKPSRFVRWCNLRDEWEADAPDQRKWFWWWAPALTVFLGSILLDALGITWWWAIAVPTFVIYGWGYIKWDGLRIKRRDLLMQMKGLAYEPH